MRSVRRESLDRIKMAVGDEAARSVDEGFDKGGLSDFVSGRFIASALAGLSRHGRPEDAEVARRWIDAPDDRKREAIALLSRFGTASDVRALITTAETSFGEDRRLAIRVALALLPGKAGALHILHATSNSEVIGLVLRALRVFEPDTAVVESLLTSKDAKVRAGAVAWMVQGDNRNQLEAFLARYLDGPTYYYNVVCWIDRVLYAPRPLREVYRDRLLGV
jgi:hypothetical protein